MCHVIYFTLSQFLYSPMKCTLYFDEDYALWLPHHDFIRCSISFWHVWKNYHDKENWKCTSILICYFASTLHSDMMVTLGEGYHYFTRKTLTIKCCKPQSHCTSMHCFVGSITINDLPNYTNHTALQMSFYFADVDSFLMWMR